MSSIRWKALDRYIRFLTSNLAHNQAGCPYAHLIPETTVTDEDLQIALDLACEIQQIQSPTFDEGARAAFMRRQFESLGLADVQLDPVGNVLARLPGANAHARPVVLSAHLDTVFPRQESLPLDRLEDRIVGPGIGDNSLSLAVLILAAGWLQHSGNRLPGDLWLAANVCEEGLGNLRGMRALVDRFGDRPLAYIILEGIGLGNIYHCGLGVARYRIHVETPGGHSWSSYGSPSAVHEIARLVTRLADLTLPVSPRTTLNVGVISGGTTVNSIASHASIDLDLRSASSQTLQFIETQVETLVNNFQQQDVRLRMEPIGRREAGEIPADHPLVEVARCVLEDLGITARLDVGSTDANVPLSRGLPAVCIGLTHGAKAHTPTEYIQTAPVRDGITQLLQLLQVVWAIEPTAPGG